MQKKILSAFLSLLVLASVAATIQWYSQQPLVTTLSGTMVLAVEKSGPQEYKSFTLASLKSWVLESPVIIDTLWATNIDVYGAANGSVILYDTNGYGVTLTVDNNLAGDYTIYLPSSLSNQPAMYVSNFFSTNVWMKTVQVYNGIYIKEWTWDGPTNTVYVGNTNRYAYTAYTPCAITNLIPYATDVENSSVLEISNASGSNITVTVYQPVFIPVEDASRVYTLTNGNTMVCSLEAISGLRSNSVVRAFKP